MNHNRNRKLEAPANKIRVPVYSSFDLLDKQSLETAKPVRVLSEKGPSKSWLSGPISRDIAILSLRYPISRDIF